MSQILDLSFALFPMFKRRQLKVYDFGGDSRSGSQFNIGLTFGAAQHQASTAHQKKSGNKKHRKRKRSPKKERAGHAEMIADGAEQIDDLDYGLVAMKKHDKDPKIDYTKHSLL